VAPATGERAPARLLEVTPALEWKAVIIGIKDVPAREGIGYRGTFRTESPVRIAIVAAGYADGVPHQLANRGMVIAGSRRTRILGAIAMDLLAIDIGHAPELQIGNVVTLLGREGEISIDAQDLGALAGTSSYAVLCGIAARVRRYYRE
jgi:alanine racemase